MFDPKQLSENIKKYRNAKNMTQTELAAALRISPQSVSKWECGLTVPDIENLCLIAKVLEVSVDRLLGDQKGYGKVMIGVDGGGSKTEFVMFAEDGTLLGRKVLGACNPNAVGLAESAALLQSRAAHLFTSGPVRPHSSGGSSERPECSGTWDHRKHA